MLCDLHLLGNASEDEDEPRWYNVGISRYGPGLVTSRSWACLSPVLTWTPQAPTPVSRAVAPLPQTILPSLTP